MIAIVVGHDERSRGAVGDDGVQEWELNRGLAVRLTERLAALGLPLAQQSYREGGVAHKRPIFYRTPGLGYRGSMRKLTAELNAERPSLVLSLHFNASSDSRATGSEALHWPTSTAGLRWAALLSTTTAATLGLKDRGPRAQASSWAGAPLYILRDTQAPAVILETHFGTNPTDHAAATALQDELARNLARVLSKSELRP